MVDVTFAASTAGSGSTYDLDLMMEALVQGHGPWVYAQTRPLAEAGLAQAQLVMGILYQLGIGVAQDGSRAVDWYTLAAAQDNALAWKNLGTLYLLGLAGVAVDKTKAHHCFSRAKILELDQTVEAFNLNQTIH